MFFTRYFIIRIILVIKLHYVLGKNPLIVKDPLDWRVVESLAEQHPYITGLLNINKEYMCTGIVIDKRTVLTAGSCLQSALHYIAVGSAVISKSLNRKNLFDIAGTSLHGDYIFELRAQDPNVTRMHSNIGLVFSVKPDLEFYIPAAGLGNYYAPELQKKYLKVIGFGKINGTNIAVLQQQMYHQTPCTNPKWYYCVCGIEVSTPKKTYKNEYGEGAPVFLDSEVVAVTAAPCGVLELRKMNVPYNIFTLIGPYLPWVDKRNSNFASRYRSRLSDTGVNAVKKVFSHNVYVLLVFTQVIFH